MEKTIVKTPKGNSGKKETPYTKNNSIRGTRKKTVIRLSKINMRKKLYKLNVLQK